MVACVKTHEVYLYGTVAVILVSVASLIGVLIIPCHKHASYQYGLLFCMSLAIGTMTGDAILHLIPEALQLHGHESSGGSCGVVHNDTTVQNYFSQTDLPVSAGTTAAVAAKTVSEEGHGSHDQSSAENYVWKMAVVMLSLYCFFVFEAAAHGLAHIKNMCKPAEVQSIVSYGSFRYACADKRIPTATSSPKLVAKSSADGTLEYNTATVWTPSPQNGHIRSLALEVQNANPETATIVSGVKKGHSHEHNHEHSANDKLIFGMRPVAIMIMFSDSVHNFCDGLAMGAAFTAGLNSGITTSIAVLCHELPHELGDFAVLLNSGLSIKKALAFNFVSSFIALAGLYVGIALGNLADIQVWLFAAIAGMFLYVSLVDMMHEIGEIETSNKLLAGFLQNFGILIGAVILLVLAVFEEDIKIA